jgi:hypothetical protein
MTPFLHSTHIQEEPMSHPVYKVGTMLDIARIPEEALPRFIKELPEMLGMLREVDTFHKATASAAGPQKAADMIAESEQHLLSGLEWIDDGREDFQVRVTARTEDGSETLRMDADSRTRDVSVVKDGEDHTYDMLIIGRLNRAGMSLTQGQIDEMMPEGRLVLPVERLHEIRDMTPESINELCIAANRTLEVVGDPEDMPPSWRRAVRSDAR